MRLTSTTVIVDGVYALTGSTHLWRRGLSFDASLAVAVFDERLEGGRPAGIRQFRRRPVSERLGLRSAQLPSDPQELVEAVRLLVERGGAARLTTETIAPADAVTPTDIDLQIWNPDGTPRPGLNAMPWLLDLSTEAQNALNAEVAPAS